MFQTLVFIPNSPSFLQVINICCPLLTLKNITWLPDLWWLTGEWKCSVYVRMDGFCGYVHVFISEVLTVNITNLQSLPSLLNMQTFSRMTETSVKTGAGTDKRQGARGVKAEVKCTLNYWSEAKWQQNFNHPKPASYSGLVRAKGLKQDTLSGYWTERDRSYIVVALMQQNLFFHF